MKWVLLAAFAAMCPLLAGLFREDSRRIRWAAFAFGFLPFVLGSWHLYIAPYGWATWPGHTKGFEVSALDSVAVAIIMATGRRRQSEKKAWPWILYAVCVAIAVPHAQQIPAALFYVWQVLRMILVYIAAIRLSWYARTAEYLLFGVFAGVISQVYFVAVQVHEGAIQAGGVFGAQNLLGMITHLAIITALGFLLAGKHTRWALPTLAAAVFVDIETASRATLGFAALGVLATLILSSTMRYTPRKGQIIVAALMVSVAISPLAVRALGKREGSNAIESSNAERDAFKRAAWLIIGDYPLGTGPNQYVIVSNVGGYSQRAGVVWNSTSRATNVHNSYLLVLAETSVAGILGMLAVLIVPALWAIRGAFRHRRDFRSEMVLAMGVAMLTVALHLFYEWAFVLFVLQYLLAAFGGMIVGLVAQMTAQARTARRKTAEASRQRVARQSEPSIA